MELYLVRHGETEWNKERRLQGQADVALDDFGRQLAVVYVDKDCCAGVTTDSHETALAAMRMCQIKC